MRLSSRSFLEASFVRPVVSTVRAVGAAGMAIACESGVEDGNDCPEPKYLSNYQTKVSNRGETRGQKSGTWKWNNV